MKEEETVEAMATTEAEFPASKQGGEKDLTMATEEVVVTVVGGPTSPIVVEDRNAMDEILLPDDDDDDVASPVDDERADTDPPVVPPEDTDFGEEEATEDGIVTTPLVEDMAPVVETDPESTDGEVLPPHESDTKDAVIDALGDEAAMEKEYSDIVETKEEMEIAAETVISSVADSEHVDDKVATSEETMVEVAADAEVMEDPAKSELVVTEELATDDKDEYSVAEPAAEETLDACEQTKILKTTDDDVVTGKQASLEEVKGHENALETIEPAIPTEESNEKITGDVVVASVEELQDVAKTEGNVEENADLVVEGSNDTPLITNEAKAKAVDSSVVEEPRPEEQVAKETVATPVVEEAKPPTMVTKVEPRTEEKHVVPDITKPSDDVISTKVSKAEDYTPPEAELKTNTMSMDEAPQKFGEVTRVQEPDEFPCDEFTSGSKTNAEASSPAKSDVWSSNLREAVDETPSGFVCGLEVPVPNETESQNCGSCTIQ